MPTCGLLSVRNQHAMDDFAVIQAIHSHMLVVVGSAGHDTSAYSEIMCLAEDEGRGTSHAPQRGLWLVQGTPDGQGGQRSPRGQETCQELHADPWTMTATASPCMVCDFVPESPCPGGPAAVPAPNPTNASCCSQEGMVPGDPGRHASAPISCVTAVADTTSAGIASIQHIHGFAHVAREAVGNAAQRQSNKRWMLNGASVPARGMDLQLENQVSVRHGLTDSKSGRSKGRHSHPANPFDHFEHWSCHM